MILQGDCKEALRAYPAGTFDSVVTDPPYGLSKEPDAAEVLSHWLKGDDYHATGGGFMGKGWDGFVPGPATWREIFRVLKPGGYALVFAGARTQDLMTMALRLAGFEIRDSIRHWHESPREAAQDGGGLAWVYGTGFPKSLNVGAAVDKLDAAKARRGRALQFTAWMRSTGLTASMIDTLTGSNMGGHYLTEKSQPAVATREHMDKLRAWIGPVPEWVEHMIQERTVESENFKRREVVGRGDSGIAGGTGEHAGESGAYGYGREYDITRTHTQEAQQWEGWGTALKPAYEPVIVARKPPAGTIAANVTEHGTGAMNIDGCRVGGKRWPANITHDGSPEVLAAFPGDAGPAARFFYCAKATKRDRDEGLEEFTAATAGEVTGGRAEGSAGLNSPRAGAGRTSGARNTHPTVKPTALMRWLARLVTPPGGIVLDPFAGSGSTGKACALEGFDFIGYELDPEHAATANARIAHAKRSIDGADNKPLTSE